MIEIANNKIFYNDMKVGKVKPNELSNKDIKRLNKINNISIEKDEDNDIFINSIDPMTVKDFHKLIEKTTDHIWGSDLIWIDLNGNSNKNFNETLEI